MGKKTAGVGKKLAVFDFDSTLIEQEIIDELAGAAGKRKEVAVITRNAMEGKIGFGESLRKRAALLKGLDEKEFGRVAKKIRFRKGYGKLLNGLLARGYGLAIVTGSFSNVLEKIRGKCISKFRVFANELEVRNGKLTGRVRIRVGNNKGKILAGLQKKLGVRKENTVVVGDGATDVPMFARAGLSIAFMAKEAAGKKADLVISEADLRKVLKAVKEWEKGKK